MHLLTKEHRPFLYFIFFVALFRLLVAPFLGLGVDEAHYVLYALNLDWSYFDHPPLVGWTHYIFTSLFGVNEFAARFSPILVGFFTSIYLYKLLYQINSDANKSFVSILALHGVFIFNALFLMLMPGTLLLLFILPIIFTVVAIEKEGKTFHWISLGVLLGLSGLSDYTAILFIPPIILYIILKKRFELFINPKILLTISISLLLISPILYWNIQHNWISFSYQSNHVLGASHINWKGFGISIARQLLAYNPFLSFVAFYGLYKAFRSKNNLLLLSALFGLVLFSFFTYSELYKTALPHWSAVFYLLFIPLGVYYLYDLSKIWHYYLRKAIGFGLILSSFIYIEIATKIVPLPNIKSLQLDIYGFKKVMQEANSVISNPKKEVIGVTNWTLASRAILYNRKYNSKVYLLDNRYDQFDLWQKGSPIGKDIIVIDISNFAHKDINKYMQCDSVTKIKTFSLLEDAQKGEKISLIKCKNYKGLK